MKLWLLTRHDKSGYDEYHSHLVRARTEDDAREIASSTTGDEDEDEWLNREKSDCTRVYVYGPWEVIISNFNAG